MSAHGLMITGTDTGVGKTFVGCGLAVALRRRGFRVAPFKPAESGCELDRESNALVPSDAQRLRHASQCEASLETISPYRFRMPVAPWVAAERAGVTIRVERLQECYQELISSHDYVLVETAGGILVPIAEHFHYADLARLLGLPVLVVAGSKLGVINQTLLTLEYLVRGGLPVIGCVLNHPDPEDRPASLTNVETLRRLMHHRLFVAQHADQGQQPGEQEEFQELANAVIETFCLAEQ